MLKAVPDDKRAQLTELLQYRSLPPSDQIAATLPTIEHDFIRKIFEMRSRNEFNRVYQELQPIFVQSGLTTADEVAQLYQQMQREMQEADFCGIGFYLTAWGQKPA